MTTGTSEDDGVMENSTYLEVAELLYGGGMEISKMNPDGADLAAKKDKRKRQITAGLSAVGATAGAAGLALGGHNLRRSYKAARTAQKVGRGLGFHAPGAKRAAFKTAVGHEKLATGLIPLEVAGLTGEVAATHILHGDTKKKKVTPVRKDLIPTRGKKVQLAANAGLKGVDLGVKGTAKGVQVVKANKGQLTKLPEKIRKTAYDVTWQGEFAKVNTDKQQVFGWASIVEVDGKPVVDLQGDYISIDEVEKSAYEYVHKSRKGGDMHLRDGQSNPVVASDMIESFVVTPEKKQALGLPDDSPTGWWVGFQVNDPELWAKVKSGQRTGFSIHGRGVRSAV